MDKIYTTQFGTAADHLEEGLRVLEQIIEPGPDGEVLPIIRVLRAQIPSLRERHKKITQEMKDRDAIKKGKSESP